MSFAEEWAQIRAEVAKQRETETRLNSTNGPKGGKKLRVDASVLNTRAKHADSVRANVTKADDAAMRETAQIASGLKGFTCTSGLRAFQERWADQVTYLTNLLANGVSSPLRAAARDFEAEDHRQASNTKV